MPKQDNYTTGYEQTDAQEENAITFASVLQGQALPGVTTPPEGNRGYLYTDTGLLIERDLTENDWRGMLPEIQAIHSAYQFIVGDWAVYGVEHGYEESYEAVAVLTGFKASTVEFYASICRNIPRLVRTNSLTFGHYQRIAPLPEEQHAYWIQKASAESMSVRELREAIAKAQLPAGTGATDETPVTVSPAADSPTGDDGDDEITEHPVLVDVKEVKKISRQFIQCVAENRLVDMPRDDFFLFVQLVNQRWSEYKRLTK